MPVDTRQLQIIDAHHAYAVGVNDLLVKNVAREIEVVLVGLVRDDVLHGAQQRNHRRKQHRGLIIRDQEEVAASLDRQCNYLRTRHAPVRAAIRSSRRPMRSPFASVTVFPTISLR